MKKEFEQFASVKKPGRLMMVVTSPRINAPLADGRVLTLAQQARSMIMERCHDVISIVVSGSGITAFGRIPKYMSADLFAKLRSAARGFKLGRAGQDLVFRLFVKKVRSSLYAKIEYHTSTCHVFTVNSDRLFMQDKQISDVIQLMDDVFGLDRPVGVFGYVSDLS